METGQPPGRRRFFVAAFPVQKIQVFVDVFLGHAAPECRIKTLGVNVLDLGVLCCKAAPTLHKAAEIAQVAIVAEGCIRAFACDDFQIAYICDDVRRGIIKGFVFFGVFLIQID